MTWMGLRDAKPQKGGEARIPCLGLVTVVTVSYFIEPMGRKNAKRMQLGGMQVIVLVRRGLNTSCLTRYDIIYALITLLACDENHVENETERGRNEIISHKRKPGIFTLLFTAIITVITIH
jgi:hypothetical protein